MVRRRLNQLWRFIVRIDVAAILIFVAIITLVFASLLPYPGRDITGNATDIAVWDRTASSGYGPVVDFLLTRGLFYPLRIILLAVPLTALCLVTFMCAVDRLPRIWRRVLRTYHREEPSINGPENMLGQHVATFNADSATPSLALVLQRSLEQQGFKVRTDADNRGFSLRADRNRLTPFATLITHFAIMLLVTGTVLTLVFAWRQQIRLGPGEIKAVEIAPGMAIGNQDFAVLRRTDGSVASYDVQLSLELTPPTHQQSETKVSKHLVRLNQPLVAQGIGFHLQGYNHTPDGYQITLLAVHDPGYSLVIIGGFLLLFGLAFTFNFPHSCVRVWIERDGAIQLSGQAARQAYDFDQEFATIVSIVENELDIEEAQPC